MVDENPQDPVKALREFVEARAAVRAHIDGVLAKEEAVRYRDCGENSKTVALARAALSAAPAILARLEAGEGLAVVRQRAEAAESALAQHRAATEAHDDKLDATLEQLYLDNGRLRTTVAALEARLAKSEAWHNKRNRSNCLHGHNNAILICETCGDRMHEAKVAALEARLAEVAPVVEALNVAIRLRDANFVADGETRSHLQREELDAVDNAISALRAARALRGAGEEGKFCL